MTEGTFPTLAQGGRRRDEVSDFGYYRRVKWLALIYLGCCAATLAHHRLARSRIHDR
jgi:hypothetical protein